MSPIENANLASSCPGERRAVVSVGLGCPSFGGQRAVGGSSSSPLAGLVTCGRSSLFTKRPRSCVASACQRRRRSTSLCRFPLAVLGKREKQHGGDWPNLEHQMPEVSTHQRCASWPSSQSSPTVA